MKPTFDHTDAQPGRERMLRPSDAFQYIGSVPLRDLPEVLALAKHNPYATDYPIYPEGEDPY